MLMSDLVDFGLALVLALMAVAVGALLGLWMKRDTRHTGRRGRR